MYALLGLAAALTFLLGLSPSQRIHVEMRAWVVSLLVALTVSVYTIIAAVYLDERGIETVVQGVLWGIVIFVAPLAGRLVRRRMDRSTV